MEVAMDHPARFVAGLLSVIALGALGAPACSTSDSISDHSSSSRAAATGGPFVEFESGQVRPIALSPDGTKLFAVDTPNNTLEIFSITAGGLAFAARVPVGLEPVAVAARTND